MGSWFWESGFDRDPIIEGEYIRDWNFRAAFGAWDCLKNVDKEYPELFALKHRMMALRKRSPAAFWFRAWLVFASVALVVGTFEGPEGFLGAKGTAVLAIFVLGWIYPFLIWVRENRDSKS